MISRTVTCRPLRCAQAMIRSDVVHAASQIRLHGQAGGEVDRLAAPLEQRERQVLEGELLDVEVHQHVVLRRRFEDRPQRLRQARSEPSKSIGSVRAQSELILIETLVRGIGPR